MINEVKIPLYPIFFENQVPEAPKTPFEDKKEISPNNLEDSASKEAEKAPKYLFKSDKSNQREPDKAKEVTSQEVTEEEKEKKEKEEKKTPIPSLMEILKERTEAEKERKPMAYSIKVIRKALEIPQQSVEILLKKLGLYNVDFII